jgi:hypothetical protein
MSEDSVIDLLNARMAAAARRYGPFASTHEALGVACEEWDELRSAIHANNMPRVEAECLDLASVLIRLALSLRSSESARLRSIK